MILAWGACWVGFLLWRSTFSRGETLRRVSALGLAALVALGSSAVHWLPIAFHRDEFTRGSGLDLETALTGGNLAFKHLWGLIFQFLTVTPLPGANPDVSMRGTYIGVLSLPLIAVAIRHRRDDWTAALGGFSAATFLMALGSGFFGRLALHLWFPALNWSRFPAGDSRALMALGLSLLAGRGMECLTSPGEEKARRTGVRALLAILAVVAVGGLALGEMLDRKTFVEGPFNFVTATIFLLGVAAALWPSIHQPFGRRAFLALLALDMGIGVHANIDVAGEKGDYRILWGRHKQQIDVASVLKPRALGADGDPTDPGTGYPANEGYVSKTFFVSEYNPLRLKRLNRLLQGGLARWLEQGPRVVRWSGPRDPATPSELLAGAQPVSFEISSYRFNRVRYRVQIPTRSMLVFNELYFPGWRARWNGRDVAMQEVASGLRGITVEAGAHDIETYFMPRVFLAALGISLATASACLGFLILRVWRRKAGGDRFASHESQGAASGA